MNNKSNKHGFTLVEILVAMVIIAAIVSMVYGSYFATSKSTQACKSKIAMSQQGRKVLEQMAGQIRCSYIGPAEEHTHPMTPTSQQTRNTPESIVSYFEGDQDNPGGEILHLVTTKSFLENRGPAYGLFEVTYKFDKNRGVLFLSQKRFTGTPKAAVQRENWRPIVENIERVELAFFDGRQWLKHWNYKEKEKVPSAVKIDITSEDENYQKYCRGTVAYICCRKNQGQEAQTERLVALKKR